MSFQTCQTSDRSSSEHKLRYFNEFWELSEPSIDSNVINTIKVQKRSKDIIKIIHVTSGVHVKKAATVGFMKCPFHTTFFN